MNDRPKKSWREIDAGRDGSRGRSTRDERPSGGSSPAADAKASKAHRAALDALFAKGEVGKYAEKLGLGGAPKSEPTLAKPTAPPPRDPEAEAKAERDAERHTLRKKILEGTSREAVGRAFDRYCKAYGAPKDWELLERGLEHPREDRLNEVLTEIEALLGKEKPRRVRTLDGRLRFIAETHDDEILRNRAAAIRSRLPSA